ncbi:MAG: DUF5110 domain-containing protein, partial [Proteobacteria bacterium]|nr:DUF5110 domain-containing protein [Pseudomonadota bacterium]
FHRNRASGQPLSELETQENFTLWFANAAWFDVPFRSHVMNLDNDRKTAPNRVGHIESNKANLIQRYRLTPYYYSLAWKAWTQGAPMMQPMSMAYPEDLRFRETGDQRMLGDVMVAAAATKGVYHRTIQMPEGVWYDLRNGSSFYSDGSPNVSLKGVPVYVNGLFQLPAFARGGALIPVLSEASMRLLADGIPVKSTGEELALEMFIGSDGRSDSFTLYEDDGETVSYRNGAVRETVMRQKTIGDIAEIVIEGAKGTFSGASDNRRWVINVHGPTGTEVEQVLVSGEGVAMCTGKDEPDVTCIRKGSSPGSLIEIIFGLEDVSVVRSANIRLKYTERPTANAHFACRDNDPSQRYYSMYAVGSDHRLGAWDVSKSIPRATNSFLRGIWTGVIAGLPASSDINWKCVKIHPQSSDRGVEWQPGQNNVLHTQEDGGFSGMTEGSFVHVWKSLSPVGPSKAQ